MSAASIPALPQMSVEEVNQDVAVRAPTDAAPQAARQQTPQVAPQDTPAVVPQDPAKEDAPSQDDTQADPLSKLQGVIPEAHLDTLAVQVIGAGGLDAVDFEITGNAMAPEDVSKHAREVQTQLQAHADEFVTAHGVDKDAFYSWMREQRPNEMRSAALTLYHSRGDMSAFAPLLTEFQRHARTQEVRRSQQQRSSPNPMRPWTEEERDRAMRDKELVTVNGITASRAAMRRAGLL